MSKFEDHLWREVARHHGPDLELAGRPRARHRRADRRVLASSTLGLAGLGTALALALGTGAASPAFAVTRHHDGTVTVWVTRPDGIAGANAKLHQLGIRAMVLPQAPARCSDLPITRQGAPASPGNVIALRGAHWTIDRKVAAGQMLALTPAPAPSLTPAAGPAGNSGNSGNSGTSGNGGTAGSSGTATRGWSQVPAPSGKSGAAGQVWTCNVQVQIRTGAGGGNSGNAGNSGNSGNS